MGLKALHAYSGICVTKVLKHLTVTTCGQPGRLQWRKAKMQLGHSTELVYQGSETTVITYESFAPMAASSEDS